MANKWKAISTLSIVVLVLAIIAAGLVIVLGDIDSDNGFFALLAALVVVGLSCIGIVFATIMKARADLADMRARGIVTMTTLPHVEGLPVGKDTKCDIMLFADKLQIAAEGKEINLALHKIIDIDGFTDVDVQKRQVSNMNQVLANQQLYGHWGARLTPTEKTKVTRTATHHLVIVYESDGGEKELVFRPAKAKEQISSALFIASVKQAIPERLQKTQSIDL
jgi:hypothetical protein